MAKNENEARIATCRCGRRFVETGPEEFFAGQWCQELHTYCPICRFELTIDREGRFEFLPTGIYELACGCVVRKEEGLRPQWPREAEKCADVFHYCDDEFKDEWTVEHIQGGLARQ